MEFGKLFGVGVGPGDFELLTLKAVRILNFVDVVAVPSSGNGEKTAFNIVKNHIGDKKILDCFLPMTKDLKRLEECYDKVAVDIKNLLEKGLNVAFITLGDPSIYSTYMRIHRKILKMGFFAEIVPGITSFSAVAAKTGISLCEGKENLVILSASSDYVDKIEKIGGNFVIMKSGKKIGEIKKIIKDKNFLKKFVMVECCGTENEKIYYDVDDIDENASYFSTIILKESDDVL